MKGASRDAEGQGGSDSAALLQRGPFRWALGKDYEPGIVRTPRTGCVVEVIMAS